MQATQEVLAMLRPARKVASSLWPGTGAAKAAETPNMASAAKPEILFIAWLFIDGVPDCGRELRFPSLPSP